MKRITLLVCVIALACFASCGKKYNCVCTATGGTNGGYAVQNESLGKISFTDAEGQCSSWENIQQAGIDNAHGTDSVVCVVQTAN